MRAIRDLCLSFPKVYNTFKTAVGGPAKYVREFIRAQNGDRILDIGCGAGDVVEHLPPDVEYVGFDLSARYIASAQRKYGHRARFYCRAVRDSTDVEIGAYDLVLATGVLHHLDDEEAKTLFAVARSALKPGGRLVTLDGCFAPEQSAVARWLLKMDRGKFVRDLDGYVRLARSAFADVRPTVTHHLLRIPYTHIVLECRKAAAENAA